MIDVRQVTEEEAGQMCGATRNRWEPVWAMFDPLEISNDGKHAIAIELEHVTDARRLANAARGRGIGKGYRVATVTRKSENGNVELIMWKKGMQSVE